MFLRTCSGIGTSDFESLGQTSVTITGSIKWAAALSSALPGPELFIHPATAVRSSAAGDTSLELL